MRLGIANPQIVGSSSHIEHQHDELLELTLITSRKWSIATRVNSFLCGMLVDTMWWVCHLWIEPQKLSMRDLPRILMWCSSEAATSTYKYSTLDGIIAYINWKLLLPGNSLEKILVREVTTPTTCTVVCEEQVRIVKWSPKIEAMLRDVA